MRDGDMRRFYWCKECDRLLGQVPRYTGVSRYCPYCNGEVEITESAWDIDE